ncbi:AraC family transcriptional regulator [Bacteroides sp. GD17]|uniref:AraC family transcriptional regulator n=1 Tax=Bacteroides sp. GD17 TaxID=3139826 RepID=UPI0025D7758E|nr:AraC family transcriptional regulator [uncultured Bacteroides sp.]
MITTYNMAMATLIPAFSSIACGILVAFALQDCLTWEERKLKKIVFTYFFVEGIAWCITFFYPFCPSVFVCLNTPCLLSYTLISVFFFRVIRYLTRQGQPENFPSIHYWLPGALAAAMLVWSFFIPFDVQVEIVRGKALVFPQGYEAYARFFTSKLPLRLLFGVVYYALTIGVLTAYYRKTDKQASIRKPAGWVLFLVAISISSLFSSLLPCFKPRAEILYSPWTLLITASISVNQILLTYHIIRRKYMLYSIPAVVTETAAAAEPQTEPRRRRHSGELNRSRFEHFIRDRKPYLNPDYKITNLVEDLDVNRTMLSAFINRTYGVNFNRYLNRRRLKELEQLRLQPANQGKSISSLIDKVGFKDFRNYTRAAAAERGSAAAGKTERRTAATGEATRRGKEVTAPARQKKGGTE